MQKRIVGSLPLWQFDLFAEIPNLAHFISGREGGRSKGETGSLNLSYNVGDEATNVDENRRRITEAMDVPVDSLLFPNQVHSNQVKLVDGKSRFEKLECADALITDNEGLCLAVLAADCVPILIYDPVQKAVGAIHAGWRGTVGKILTRTIEAMAYNFGSKPSDLKVGIGPSISPLVYEVGEEVVAAVQLAFPDTASRLLFPADKKEKAYFDLWEANSCQLQALGVSKGNIEIAGICTYMNSTLFFSARASQKAGGRFAAGIVLKKEIEN